MAQAWDIHSSGYSAREQYTYDIITEGVQCCLITLYQASKNPMCMYAPSQQKESSRDQLQSTCAHAPHMHGVKQECTLNERGLWRVVPVARKRVGRGERSTPHATITLSYCVLGQSGNNPSGSHVWLLEGEAKPIEVH
jgi:hypothetical protein